MHVRVLTEQVHDAVFVAVVADELQGDGAAVPLRPQRSDKRPDAHSHDVPQANEAHGLEVRPGEQAEMPVRRVVMYSPSIRALRMPVSDS